MDFSNQTILVTGASKGIGREVTRALLDRGAKVAACARGKEGLDRLQIEAGPAAERLFTLSCDVSRAREAEDFVRAAIEKFGGPHGLVNNAGLYPVTKLIELEEEEWDRVVGTNLKGPYLLTRAVARVMIHMGIRGRIVNVSSTASLVARPGITHYASSKAGLNMLTRVMALELAPYGIRVNAVLPGLIATEGVREQLRDEASRLEHHAKLARIALGKEGSPGDVADAVVFLLSERSKYCTGSLLVVDGGYSLGLPSYAP